MKMQSNIAPIVQAHDEQLQRVPPAQNSWQKRAAMNEP
jgi:hypothetical protein